MCKYVIIDLEMCDVPKYRMTENYRWTRETIQIGAVLLNEKGRKIVLATWQKRKSEEIKHPFLEEKIEWGMVPYAQALLLARYVRGDLDTYPVFMWK